MGFWDILGYSLAGFGLFKAWQAFKCYRGHRQPLRQVPGDFHERYQDLLRLGNQNNNNNNRDIDPFHVIISDIPRSAEPRPPHNFSSARLF